LSKKSLKWASGERLSITKFEAESIYWTLGDAYWRKAKETGMNAKNVNDDAWRNLNEAILYWIQALPLPAALRDISKAYRFQAKIHYNKKNIKPQSRYVMQFITWRRNEPLEPPTKSF